MFVRIVFLLISLYGAYCIYYGIRFGLIEKRMLRNYWRGTQYTGNAAVLEGLAYITIGVISLLIIVIAWTRLNI